MAYTAAISRSNPSCFLFLIDQSGSMDEVMNPTKGRPADVPFQKDGQEYTDVAEGPTTAHAVVEAINRLLQNLSAKCVKSEGERDYFRIGVIAYGGDNSTNRV